MPITHQLQVMSLSMAPVTPILHKQTHRVSRYIGPHGTTWADITLIHCTGIQGASINGAMTPFLMLWIISETAM